MTNPIFYTTEDCHLCELAEQEIVSALAGLDVQVEVIDIAESAELVAKYGEVIPVFYTENRVLNWPFDAAMVRELING